MSLNNQRMC